MFGTLNGQALVGALALKDLHWLTCPSVNFSNGGSASTARGTARAAAPPAKLLRKCNRDFGILFSVLRIGEIDRTKAKWRRILQGIKHRQ